MYVSKSNIIASLFLEHFKLIVMKINNWLAVSDGEFGVNQGIGQP